VTEGAGIIVSQTQIEMSESESQSTEMSKGIRKQNCINPLTHAFDMPKDELKHIYYLLKRELTYLD